METCVAGADEWRGGDGPLLLERGPAAGPLFDAFFAAVQQAGYPLTTDVNGYRQEGLREVRPQHLARPAAGRGARVPASGADAPNLEVRTRTFVDADRVRGHARGRRRGRTGGSIRADEVILCGGAINSPQLLQLSGVGNPGDSARSGSTLHDLPGVGENLQDHLEVYVQRASTQPVTMAPYYKWRTGPASGSSGSSAKTAPARRTTSRQAGSSARTTTSRTRT